jgi:hypothetical protein
VIGRVLVREQGAGLMLTSAGHHQAAHVIGISTKFNTIHNDALRVRVREPSDEASLVISPWLWDLNDAASLRKRGNMHRHLVRLKPAVAGVVLRDPKQPSSQPKSHASRDPGHSTYGHVILDLLMTLKNVLDDPLAKTFVGDRVVVVPA